MERRVGPRMWRREESACDASVSIVAVGPGALGGYTPGEPALRSVTLTSGGGNGVPTASRLARQKWARGQSLQASLWVRTPKARGCPRPTLRWQVVLPVGGCLNGLLPSLGTRWDRKGGKMVRVGRGVRRAYALSLCPPNSRRRDARPLVAAGHGVDLDRGWYSGRSRTA